MRIIQTPGDHVYPHPGFLWIIQVLGHHKRPQIRWEKNRKGCHETQPVRRVRTSGCLEEIWLLRGKVITEYNWTVSKSVHVSMLTKIRETWMNIIEHYWTIEPHWTWTCTRGILHVTVMKIDRLDPLAIPLWKGHISGASTWGVFFCAAPTCGSCVKFCQQTKPLGPFWRYIGWQWSIGQIAKVQQQNKKQTHVCMFLHQRRLFALGAVLQGAGFRKECCRTLGERFITSMA